MQLFVVTKLIEFKRQSPFNFYILFVYKYVCGVYVCMCVHAHACTHLCVPEHVWWSEDNL